MTTKYAMHSRCDTHKRWCSNANFLSSHDTEMQKNVQHEFSVGAMQVSINHEHIPIGCIYFYICICTYRFFSTRTYEFSHTKLRLLTIVRGITRIEFKSWNRCLLAVIFTWQAKISFTNKSIMQTRQPKSIRVFLSRSLAFESRQHIQSEPTIGDYNKYSTRTIVNTCFTQRCVYDSAVKSIWYHRNECMYRIGIERE